MRAAAAGDLAAFEALVRAYQADVWRFLCHLLRDAALAEDVLLIVGTAALLGMGRQRR